MAVFTDLNVNKQAFEFFHSNRNTSKTYMNPSSTSSVKNDAITIYVSN